MNGKAPEKHHIVLIAMIIAGVIMAGVGLITLRQSNIIVAVGLFIAAFVYWRNHRSAR